MTTAIMKWQPQANRVYCLDALGFIVGLMKQGCGIEPAQLSNIPAPTVEQRYIANNQFVIQTDRRGRQLGYVLHGVARPGGILHITHAIIDIDRRNLGFGETAIQTVMARARYTNCRSIALRCAEDLPANEFWLNQGFRLTKTDHPRNKRQRAINTYMLDLWRGLWAWEDLGVAV